MKKNKEIKILSPLARVEEVEPLINVGANEFYSGILFDSIPENLYGKYFSDFSMLKEAIRIAHRYKARVFLIVNRRTYAEDQYFDVIEKIKEGKKCGVDAFIIANLPLLLLLKKERVSVELHLSTLTGVFNSSAIQFFKDLGVSRIILPDHLLLKEIKQLVKSVKNVEFEVFVMNNQCLNTESLCTFRHLRDATVSKTCMNLFYKYSLTRKIARKIYDDCLKKLPKSFIGGLTKFGFKKDYLNFLVNYGCLLSYDISFLKKSGKHFENKIYDNLKTYFDPYFHIQEEFRCGVCAMEQLYNSNIKVFKIMGRHHPLEKKIKDVKFARSLIEFLEKKEKTQQEIDFHSFVKKKRKEIFGTNCKEVSCYYPYEMW